MKSDLRDASQAMIEVWDAGEHGMRDSPGVSGLTAGLSISAAPRTRFDAHFSFDLLRQTSRERFRASDGRSEAGGSNVQSSEVVLFSPATSDLKTAALRGESPVAGPWTTKPIVRHA